MLKRAIIQKIPCSENKLHIIDENKTSFKMTHVAAAA